MTRRIHSFVWGGLAAALFIIFGILSSEYIFGIVLGILSFVSCLILHNNFIGEMMLEIFSWGFVRMPGLIFTLDLDGILWLLTVKLLFWILGLILAVICGILAVALGFIVSVFVYPFAIYKNLKHGNELNT